jgi:hypothetical protein
MSHVKDRRLLAAACAAAVLSLPARLTASIQYDIVVLDNAVQVNGIDHGNAIGADHTLNPTIWSNHGTIVTHLPTPPGFAQFPAAYAISGDEVVGIGSLETPHTYPHPILWSGPNHTGINLYLDPAGGEADGVYNGVQVGVANQGAALWRGTP